MYGGSIGFYFFEITSESHVVYNQTDYESFLRYIKWLIGNR